MVVCDRYLDATRAYQGAGRGLPLDWIEAIHALEPLRLAPDTTILLDLDPAVGLERARGRNARGGPAEGRFEAEDLPFHRRVRDGYLALAKSEPARFRVVDASGDPEAVQRRIQEALCISAA
jgi:dTMP kinase